MKTILKTIIILILGTIIVDYIFVMSTGRKPFIVFSELENYDAIRKHIPIKKYMLKK